jgi:hypothetical protein
MSGIGDAVKFFAGASGSISLPAAASGGAIIDRSAISGEAGLAAGGFGGAGSTDETVAGAGSGATVGAAVTLGSFSAAAATVVVTGATIGGGLACSAAVSPAGQGGACWTDAGAAACLATVPVTDSSPCSSELMRENSRSRSVFSVSIAEASRLASLWLSRATD